MSKKYLKKYFKKKVHVTRDMLHMICDMLHVTNFFEKKEDWINQLFKKVFEEQPRLHWVC